MSKYKKALDDIGNIACFVAENCGNADTAKYMNDIISIVQATLAEPLRNCDIGTVAEQKERFDKYCASRKCYECPVYFQNQKSVDCGLWWAQMPYEKEANFVKNA